jgi:hypothetical protein
MRTYEGTVIAVEPNKIRVQTNRGTISLRRNDAERWERKGCIGPCHTIFIRDFDEWWHETTRDIVGLQVEVILDFDVSRGVYVCERSGSAEAAVSCALLSRPNGN